MKRTSVLLLSMGIFLSFTGSTFATSCDREFGFPFFSQRPQVLNTARRMVGEVQLWNCYDIDRVNGVMSITPEYKRSFDRDAIGKFLFFNGFNTMKFGPPVMTEDGERVDVAAREFLLGEGFVGDITTKPRVENVLVDVAFRIGLDEWVEGLYIDIHSPITWTRWDLMIDSENQTVISTGSTIPAGQIGNAMDVPAPFNNIVEAWKGNATIDNVKEELKFAIVDGKRTITRLADIEFAFGYNFINRCWMHLGANLRVIAPTGNRPDATYLFEPVAGDGKHTGLGAGLGGHFELWNNECDQSFTLYFLANFYHMFRSRQERTFDLKGNGPGSRYLLLKRFTRDDDGNFIYDEFLNRGSNVTTLDAKVSIDFQADASFLFQYMKCGFTFDVGYNIWGRTAEKIKLAESIQKETWGIQGNTGTLAGSASRNTTASQSQINGANFDMFDTTPVFISDADMDIDCAAAPSALSHKAFAHLGYTWDGCDYSPFFGVGGEVEFSGKKDFALDQWGVWIKGGFFFS